MDRDIREGKKTAPIVDNTPVSGVFHCVRSITVLQNHVMEMDGSHPCITGDIEKPEVPYGIQHRRITSRTVRVESSDESEAMFDLIVIISIGIIVPCMEQQGIPGPGFILYVLKGTGVNP
jgi:hypothetical protein